MEFINQFEVKVFHKPGKSPEMSIVDDLSQVATAGLTSVRESQEMDDNNHTEPRCLAVKGDYDMAAKKMSVDMIKDAQSQCPVISDLIRLFKEGGERVLDRAVADMFNQRVLVRLF